MQKIIEKVIESRNFELSDMLKKIDTLWVQGKIDDAARKTLSDKARSNATAGQGIDILAKLEEMDKRIKALEEANENTVPDAEEPTETIYPDYTAGKWYYAGDRVAFEGKVYECIAPEGVVCTWSPSEYPVYWQEVL